MIERVDAAFGSLLTTLSGGDRATLAVPTASGALSMVPLPPTGTLRSASMHWVVPMTDSWPVVAHRRSMT